MFLPQGQTLTIGMLLFPALTQLDLTAPYEVMVRLPNTKIHLISETTDPIRSEHGLTITPDTTFETAPQVDLIFVPGGLGINAQLENDRFLDFLSQQGQNAAYVTSVCTGSLLLGAAGLLTGYKATTHWQSLDLLEVFGAEVIRERVVIDRNRITGGGVTAGLDFGLALAAQIYGQQTAEKLQLQIEYDPQPPFNSGSPRTANPALVTAAINARAEVQAKRKTLIEAALNRRQVNSVDQAG